MRPPDCSRGTRVSQRRGGRPRASCSRLVVESTSPGALWTRRTLQLAGLRAADPMKWGIERESLIGSLPTQCHQTAMRAKAIREQFAIVDVRGGGDASFLNDVRKAGERSGIRIARSRIRQPGWAAGSFRVRRSRGFKPLSGALCGARLDRLAAIAVQGSVCS